MSLNFRNNHCATDDKSSANAVTRAASPVTPLHSERSRLCSSTDQILVGPHDGASFYITNIPWLNGEPRAIIHNENGQERLQRFYPFHETDHLTTGWSTPLVLEHGRKHQVVVNATGKVRSYDLTNGKEIRSCAGQTVNAIP